MKKNQIALLMWLVIIVVVGVGAFIFSNSMAVPDNDNQRIISEVTKLENLAKDYIRESSSTSDSTTLTLDYIRSMRYSDAQWNMLLGTPDSGFSDYVTSHGGVDIQANDFLTDENTYKRTDFVHMIAVLGCYHKYGDSVRLNGIMDVSTDYSGWAGDLLTLTAEVYNYRTTNSITDADDLLEYAHSLLGTNKASSFDTNDAYGDLDAIILYKNDDFDLSKLGEALTKYYIDADGDVNYTNRVESAKTYIGSDETAIKSKANTLLRNTVVQNYLVPTVAGHLEDIDYTTMTQAFADYLLQKPYLEITSNSGSGVVGGEDLSVKLYESNLGVPVISMTKDICDVEVLNDTLYIKPTNAGSTVITISSFNNRKSVTYTLTSTNVAPSITKQLDQEYTLSSGVESSITLTANGTNNTYTWYMADTKDGEYSRLGVTAIPTYKFTPTMEMDGKYIKCVISNEGNTSVESISALIHVRNVTLGDIVGTGDMTLVLGLSIIFMVVCANIFVYSVRKYKYNLF